MYVNSAFSPNPDESVIDLYNVSFSTDTLAFSALGLLCVTTVDITLFEVEINMLSKNAIPFASPFWVMDSSQCPKFTAPLLASSFFRL